MIRTMHLLMLPVAMTAALRAGEPRPMTPGELQARVNALNAEITALAKEGKAAEGIVKLRELLAVRRQLYPSSTHPKGHPDIAVTLTQLGAAQMAVGEREPAKRSLEQSLAMWRDLYPDAKKEGHFGYARALYQAAAWEERFGSAATALPLAEQALAMRLQLFPESQFPNGHPMLAASITQVGNLLNESGDCQRAEPHLQRAYAMNRQLYPRAKFPNGTPELADSMGNLAIVLRAKGDIDRAVALMEEMVAIKHRQFPAERFPKGHPELMRALRILGEMQNQLGAFDKSLANGERALEMARALFPASLRPTGHFAIASALNLIGVDLTALGALDRARECFEQSLAMCKTLYPAAQFPDGHPLEATLLGNLGRLMRKKGAYAQEHEYCSQTLAMGRKLFPAEKYPNGHVSLVQMIHSVGGSYHVLGRYEEARPYYEEALAMRRKLYPESRFPDGHPQLIQNITDLGGLWGSLGQPARALPYFEAALDMEQRWLERQIASASEEDALSYAQNRPVLQTSYLSATLFVPGTDAKVYGYVWEAKAAIARVLDQRHVVARAAGPEQAARVAKLRDLRLQTEALLQDSSRRPAERDAQLAAIADQRNVVERELTTALADWTRRQPRDLSGPEELLRSLPPNSAFIDLLGYERYQQDPDRKGLVGEKWIPHYAAFIALPGAAAVRRVELGEAKPIKEAVADWRRAIENRLDGDATRVRKLVWDKLAPHLPASTRTVYLSPDRELTRLPWCALPGSKPGSVLLEEFAGGIAVVPHGPFLLQELRKPRPFDPKGALLTVGGVDYGKADWPALTGTKLELAALEALPTGKRESLTSSDASPRRVTDGLLKASCAHLATHGFFNEDAIRAERRRAEEARRAWQLGDPLPPAPATRHPLGYTGVVLAQSEVLTGLALVDLPLENLRLVTLSACETGLGDFFDGQGVQGLQRALHLAGCPNVIASLWQVNDAATAALMAQFYYELWLNKKPPIEALREAQLTIYRHPERIPELAGERGRPALDAAAKLGSARTTKPDEKPKTTPTKLWAAFVLSGVGK